MLCDYHALSCLQQTLCEHVSSSQEGDMEEEPGQRIIALEATSAKDQKKKTRKTVQRPTFSLNIFHPFKIKLSSQGLQNPPQSQQM